MNISPEIEKFLNSIVDHADQEDMTPELRQKMVENLAEHLDSYLTGVAIDQLSDPDLDAYDLLITSQPTPEQVQQFLMQHVPNIDQVMRQAMIDFKSQYTTVE